MTICMYMHVLGRWRDMHLLGRPQMSFRLQQSCRFIHHQESFETSRFWTTIETHFRLLWSRQYMDYDGLTYYYRIFVGFNHYINTFESAHEDRQITYLSVGITCVNTYECTPYTYVCTHYIHTCIFHTHLHRQTYILTYIHGQTYIHTYTQTSTCLRPLNVKYHVRQWGVPATT